MDDAQLLAQLQGVDIGKLPQKLSTPQGFHSQFGDMVGGHPQISDAILNHIQNNMGLNVDAVAMDDLIGVVQEQVDLLAQQTEAMLAKFRRTQAGLSQAADTLNQVSPMGPGAPPPNDPGILPPPDMGGGAPPVLEGAPPPEGNPPPLPEGGGDPLSEAPPPPAEEPVPPPPPAEEPLPEELPPEEKVSDAGLKEVEQAVENAAEEEELSEEEYEMMMSFIDVMSYLLKEYGDMPAEGALPVEETPAAEEAPAEAAEADPGTDFDGENLSKLMADINTKHF
jgi:hypothetical protein